MFDLSDPATRWLNITNIGLGVLVLVCWTLLVVGVARELVKRRKRRLAPVLNLQEFQPELGVTMADGGQPVEPAPATKPDEKTS